MRGPPGAPRPPRATRASSRPRTGEDCLGIICGFGRGAPGTPPGRGVRASRSPSRAAGARGGSCPGPEPPGRCIPWVEENGLLPGRGAPGRGALGVAARAAGASGTGLEVAGAGASEGPMVGATGAVPFVSTAGASGAGAACAGAPTSTGAGLVGSTTLAAAFLAGLAAALPWALSCSPKFSLRRRTTGASTVDDADRTNSPMSLSVFSTTLLSTPYSLASS